MPSLARLSVWDITTRDSYINANAALHFSGGTASSAAAAAVACDF
jgi:hypothetical protein